MSIPRRFAGLGRGLDKCRPTVGLQRVWTCLQCLQIKLGLTLESLSALLKNTQINQTRPKLEVEPDLDFKKHPSRTGTSEFDFWSRTVKVWNRTGPDWIGLDGSQNQTGTEPELEPEPELERVWSNTCRHAVRFKARPEPWLHKSLGNITIKNNPRIWEYLVLLVIKYYHV